jgi:hypothetical protein
MFKRVLQVRALLKKSSVFTIAVMLAAGAASASTIWDAVLSPANEVPPHATPASGLAVLTLTGDTLGISLTFNDLTNPASAGHIHCCALPGTSVAVVLPFTGLPNATTGSYNANFNLADPNVYSAAFVTSSGGTAAGAEASLIAAFNSNMAYVNMHDATYPGGEIRGQVTPLPEPSALFLAGTALAGFALYRRKRNAAY